MIREKKTLLVCEWQRGRVEAACVERRQGFKQITNCAVVNTVKITEERTVKSSVHRLQAFTLDAPFACHGSTYDRAARRATGKWTVGGCDKTKEHASSFRFGNDH